jgi:hypothetical protein
VNISPRWQLVISLVLLVTSAATAQSAPRVAGVALGTTSRGVRATLGKPDREQESLGMRFWDYSRRGISVIWRDGSRGVRGIVVSRAAAGDVNGIKVGDAETAVRTTLGAPARVRQDGRFLDYVGADWVLSIELNQGSVAQITLLKPDAPH